MSDRIEFEPVDRFGIDSDDGIAAALIERGLSMELGIEVQMGQSRGGAFNIPGQHQGDGWHVDAFGRTEADTALLGRWDDWCDRNRRQYTYPTPAAAAAAFWRDWGRFRSTAESSTR